MYKTLDFVEHAAKESQTRFDTTIRAYVRYLMLGSGAAIAFVATHLLEGKGTLDDITIKVAIIAFGFAIIVSGFLLYLLVAQTYYEAKFTHLLFGFLSSYGHKDEEGLTDEVAQEFPLENKMRSALKFLVGTSLVLSGMSFAIGMLSSLVFLVHTV